MSTDQMIPSSVRSYPTRQAHGERWVELAGAIAAERERMTDDPELVIPAVARGELTIIGSGIEAVGFTSSDEILIHEAEYVFYCVADPATSVWIKSLRPDAYDLYVLYDDSKLRYLTYMQMTEAILHYVRKGKKVVAIYYGHPGIFVLSTHRAIQIARREGHQAVMRAGVSALDTLCADLGVDPSQPGMQMYEATDMLIRGRKPDTGLHLVLWQVGLIGELGYRRSGYLNSGFAVLLDYLEDIYGADHTVIHYIGSRYPGIDPLIGEHTIGSLRDPETQTTVTGISTFYLPPKDAAAADQNMLLKLGLLQPGQTAKSPTGPLREIDRYGAREMKAFDDFERFRVPSSYYWQEDTAAARFILALREDGGLRDLYVRDPAAAVAKWSMKGLTPRDQSLLSRRDAGSMQIAAKGIRAKSSPDSARMLTALLTNKAVLRGLHSAVQRAEPNQRRKALDDWSAGNGYTVDWSVATEDLTILMRTALFPWTGFYLAKDRQLSFFLHGRIQTGGTGTVFNQAVYMNGQALKHVRYSKGSIRWYAEDGNPNNGFFHTDLTPKGARRLVGAIWPEGETMGSQHRLAALEHFMPHATQLSAIAGEYRVKDGSGRTVSVVVRPDYPGQSAPVMAIEIDGQPFQGQVAFQANGFALDGLAVPYAGKIIGDVHPHLQGEYRIRAVNGKGSQQHRLAYDGAVLMLNDQAMDNVRGKASTLNWKSDAGLLARGDATMLLDPITLRPMLFGTGRSDTMESFSLVGMAPIGHHDVMLIRSLPKFNLPPWAWDHLVTIAAEANGQGGHFLWHSWDKAVKNLAGLRSILQEVHL
ncbi:SAM-dependent methyltransferase [Paenibacillus terricola]|nr:SAM-dependent methyltransferase [Paenibacillus terricola]